MLPEKLGPCFELRSMGDLNPFGHLDDHVYSDLVLLGSITINHEANIISVNGDVAQQVFWNGSSNTIGWVSPESEIIQGHLSFSQDLTLHTGMITYSDGYQIIVTGGTVDAERAELAIQLQSDFLPKYDDTIRVDSVASGIFDFISLVQDNSNQKTTDVQGLVYKMERHEQDDDDEQAWVPYYDITLGMEIVDATSAVCYIDDVDISADTILESKDRAIILTKSGAHILPKNRKSECTLNMKIIGEAVTGTMTDKRGNWDLRGKFFGTKTLTRPGSEFDQHGPDGVSTFPQFLAVTNLNSAGEDIAQKEGDKIFGRILLASVPGDIKEKLYPNMPKLDQQEEKISKLGEVFLERAGVVYLLRQFSDPDNKEMPQKYKDKIDATKCGAFFTACAGGKLDSGQDGVEAFGWNPKEDANIIKEVQEQYRAVVTGCYRLAYSRVVVSFQPFLKHGEYWYKRFANYLVSPAHKFEFSGRTRSHDKLLAADVYNWQTKLFLLGEAGGVKYKKSSTKPEPKEENSTTKPEPKDKNMPLTILEIMNELQGAAFQSLINNILWSDSLIFHLKQFFEELEKIGNDEVKSRNKEYMKVQEYMAEREAYTWREIGKSIIEVVESQAKKEAWKKLSVGDLVALGGGPQPVAVPETVWRRCKKYIAPAIITSASFMLIQDFLGHEHELSMEEKISMFAVIAGGLAPIIIPVLQTVSSAITPLLSWFFGLIARVVGRALQAIIPERALGFINGAAGEIQAFAHCIGRNIRFFANGFVECAKFIFGFMVSVIVVWSAVTEFSDLLKNERGRLVDKIFSGIQLGVAVAGCIVAAVETGAAITAVALSSGGALTVCAWCGPIGLALAAIGVTVAIIAYAIDWALKEDIIDNFITTYGGKYHLLK